MKNDVLLTLGGFEIDEVLIMGANKKNKKISINIQGDCEQDSLLAYN